MVRCKIQKLAYRLDIVVTYMMTVVSTHMGVIKYDEVGI